MRKVFYEVRVEFAYSVDFFFFFFQAEDGIRDIGVTGVQTCALPISLDREKVRADREERVQVLLFAVASNGLPRPDARFSLRATRGTISAPRVRKADRKSVV